MSVGAGDVLGDAYVNVLAETRGLTSGFARALSMTKGFCTSVGGMVLGSFAGAFAVAGGAVVAGLKAYMPSEQVNRKLADTLSMVGVNAEASMPKIQKLADAIARKSKFDDEAIKTAVTMGYQLGGTSDKMEGLTKAAVGLSSRLGMDVPQSMRMLMRASQGNTMFFRRMGVEIDMTKSKAQQFQQILEFAKKGEMMAEGETKTLAGSLGMVKKAFGEVLESFGEGISRSVSFTSAIQDLSNWFWGLKEKIDKLIESGKFTEWVDTIVGGFRYMVADIKAGFSLIALPLRAFIDVLMAAFNLLGAALVEPIKSAFTVTGGIIGNIAFNAYNMFRNLGQNIGTFFEAVWEKVTHPTQEFVMPKLKGLGEGNVGLMENVKPMDSNAWLNGIEAAAQTFVDTIADVPENFRKRYAEIAKEWVATNEKVSASIGKGPQPDKYLPTGKGKGDKTEGGKAKVEITGFAEFWKKAQANVIKDANDKKALDAAVKTEANTDRSADALEEMAKNKTGGGGALWSTSYA